MENKATFIKVSSILLSVPINKITPTEKIFFSYIISWQINNRNLTANNEFIANTLGLTTDGVKTLIKRCNAKYNFFNSKQNYLATKRGSNHIISINEELLLKFCESNLLIRGSSEPLINKTKTTFQNEKEEIYIENNEEEENMDAIYNEYIAQIIKTDYSDYKFKLWNGNIVFVENEQVDYWLSIQNKIGIMKLLKHNYNQVEFDYMLRDKNKEYIIN